MKTHFFILFISISCIIQAQNPDDSVQIRIQELSQLCEQADTLHHTWEENDIVDSVQNLIADKLILLLKSPTIKNYDLEKLLNNEFLSIIISSDKKIKVFQWDENTGGTFRSSARIIAYLDKNENLKLLPVKIEDYEIENYVSGGELWANKITKLKSPRNIYLIEESAATCSTCYAEYVQTVELTNSGLIAYDGFYGDDNYGENDFKTSSFGIDYRWNESNSLVYDPDRQALIYSYFEDDLSGYDGNPDSARYITDTLKFNGEMFVDPVMQKIAALRTVIEAYNNTGQNADSINYLNEVLYNSLADLLLTNGSFEYGVDYFLNAAPWEILKSDDERILIYMWSSDRDATTMEYSGNIHMVVYRDYENKFHLLSGAYGSMEERSQSFITEPMFNFYSVQKIFTTSTNPVYLFTGEQMGCIRCKTNYFAFTTEMSIDDGENKTKMIFSPLIQNNPQYDTDVNAFQYDKDKSELWYTEFIPGESGKIEHAVIYRFNGKLFYKADR